jgi:hypothetical protein
MGYSNYTFPLSATGNSLAPMVDLSYLSTPNCYVKKFQTGYFNVGANMNNLQPSDYIFGYSYVGTSSSGLAQIIYKGAVVASINLSLSGGMQYLQPVSYFNNFPTIASLGNGKAALETSILNFQMIDVGGNSFNLEFDASTLSASELSFDTYLMKTGLIVDVETGTPGTWTPVSTPFGPASGNWWLEYYPFPITTLPNVVLPCAPITPWPNYTPPAPIT